LRNTICIALLFLMAMLIASKKEEKAHAPTPSEAYEDLDRFNSMVSGIKSLRFNEIGQGPIKVSVDYARNKGIKFTQKTAGREELTAAADQNKFWFWCRSFDPLSVYHCERQNISLTRLRPELYPCIAAGLLCSDPIPRDRVTMINRPSGPVVSTMEEGLVRELELREGKIVSQVFYSGDVPLVSMKFTEFQESCGFTLPKTASVIWHEQGRRITLRFGSPELNSFTEVDTSMPQGLRRVGLEEF
jgi:hypothetical protein